MLDPNLASSIRQWYALVQERVPNLDSGLRLEIEDYCGGERRNVAPNSSVQVMGQVLQDNQPLKDTLGDTLGSNYKAVSTALLTMWHASTTRRPMSEQQLVASMDQWRDADLLNMQVRGSKKTDQLLSCMLTVADTMASGTRSCFFTALYNSSSPFLARRSNEVLEPDIVQARADLYVTLGHCALSAVNLELRQAQWHEKIWKNAIAEWFEGPQHDRDLLANTIVTSTLPGQYKLRVFQGLPAIYWHLPLVKEALLPSLPEGEHHRVEHLAWTQAHIQGNQPLEELLREANQKMVRAYCPDMYPLLELGLSPSDWTNQQTVAQTAERFALAQYRAQVDTYTLPDDSGVSP